MLGVGLGLTTLRGRGAGFSPLDIPNLAGWYDPSDLSTITESGGDVSQLDDKSGNGLHLTQATALRQPDSGTRSQNGLNVLEFSGGQLLVGGDIYDLGTSSFTSVGVAARDSGTSSAGFWGKSAAAGTVRWSMLQISSTLYSFLHDGVTGKSATTSNNTTAAQIIGNRIFRGDKNELLRNGVVAATTSGVLSYTWDTTRVFGIGAYQNDSGNFDTFLFPLDGFIGEILLYSRALTDDELAQVNTYLSVKWGVALA